MPASPTSPRYRKQPANPYALFFVRAGVLAVVALLCSITLWYCTSVYFDQNQALQEVFQCASKVMSQSNTTFWLDRGTLLGAKRNKKFVVWEGDVTLGAMANFTGSLYKVMSEVSTKCDLHFDLPREYLAAQAAQARAKADELATTVTSKVSGEQVTQVAWYLYNAHVGLRVLEWTPSEDLAGSTGAQATTIQSAATAAHAAGTVIGARLLSHGQKLIHTMDTFLPPRPCEIHAFQAFCPNNEVAVLESHFGAEWFTAPLMSLFK